ncbi:MAG: FKBP-type peptidyl-prolyl cis-trans isomerase, partial [Candidatus Thermoplasmatota archaeon]|nr:FKBP-type peptidyl-prolyl cis-trans isomerase [Candidatus Thermoplasmatota archaeon]
MELKDVIKLDFELWVKETKELVDTTKEDVAKDNDKHDDNNVYGPMPTIVGVEKLLPAMDKDLLSAKVGEERELEIPPQDAYGTRDPKLMELCSMHEILKLPEFKKKEEFPDVGMEINLRGKKGIIVSMTSGRVRVDFNHPLAGKTLLYKYTVAEKAEKDEEKASWIIQSNYAKSSEFKVKVKDSEAEITLPDVCKYDDSWFLSKYRVVSDLREVLDLTTIRFVEEYVKKAEKDEDNTVATTVDAQEETSSGAKN